MKRYLMNRKNEIETDTARQIMLILGSNPVMVKSWGFNSPHAISDGLSFRVNGYRFKGIVQITYNWAEDNYDIDFISDTKSKQTKEDILFTSVVDEVDRFVETAILSPI